MFERIVAIDWSGADTDDAGADIRVAEWSRAEKTLSLLPPLPPAKTQWSRRAFETWMVSELEQEPAPRTLFVFDFAMGLPWGSDRALFRCQGWIAMIERIAALFQNVPTAREVASQINVENPPGPFRFNEARNAHRHYLDQNVGYYRLAEIATPQSVSPWYLGSGATVGFQTLTGLSMLHRILSRRSACRFPRALKVWPHEGLTPKSDAHVVAECYPSMSPLSFVPTNEPNPHARDALRVAAWLSSLTPAEWPSMFQVPPISFGRYEGVPLEDQIRFEGWILGIR